jgi:F-type H+-transporting ATPase subunit b
MFLSIAAALLIVGMAGAGWTQEVTSKTATDHVAAQAEHVATAAEGAAERAPLAHSSDEAAHGEAAHSEAAHAEHAAPHAAGHNEFDLGHGNASPELENVAKPQFDMAIYSFVVFLILLGVLYKFAWGPIALALQRREETIARQIDDARLASERAAHQLREYEARLAAATEEARHIVSEARKDAEIAKDRIVAEARDAAGRERERAVADITLAKNQALDAIAQRSVQTAVSLASQLIGREVRPNEHEALIGQAIDDFSKLESGKVRSNGQPGGLPEADKLAAV